MGTKIKSKDLKEIYSQSTIPKNISLHNQPMEKQ